LNKDFTYGRNFSTFLGSFWSSIFDEGALGDSIGYASSEMLCELYLDVLDTINASSVDSIPVFNRRNIYPLVISESQLNTYSEKPFYGNEGNYGRQLQSSKYESGTYLQYGEISRLNANYVYPVSSNISKIGGVALNRLFNPSVTLVNDSDYLLKDNKVFFRKNPFDNNLIPKRAIQDPITGGIDREIVIWFCDVDEDDFKLYNKYGFIFTNIKKSSEQYKKIIQKLFNVLSNGSSSDSLRSYLSVVAGSPVIVEAQETVQEISDGPEGKLIITDKNIYAIDKDIDTSNDVVIGETLKSGTPVADIVEVYNTKKAGWWNNLSAMPMKIGSTSNTSGFISFPNKYEKGEYGTQLSSSQYSKPLYFKLIGDKKYIDEFWENLNQKSKKAKINWGHKLFGKYSTTKTDSDFLSEKDIFLNPAEIFCEDLFKDNILPVKIKLNKVKNYDIFFSTIDPIDLITPVNCILMLFLDVDLIDECNFINNYSQSISIDLDTVIKLKLEDLPASSIEKTNWFNYSDKNESLEMISIDNTSGKKAGRFYKDNFTPSDINSSGFLIEKFDLSITDNLVENIEIKQIPKCAII
jgi:hypothetical protein